MAAMVTATSNANGEKDWRDECVKPQKDDRIQTLVSTIIFTFLQRLSGKMRPENFKLFWKNNSTGCDRHERSRV